MPEIKIRPAVESDLPILVKFDHSYSSEHVWQMELGQEAGQMGVNFRQIRLPRATRVEYPRSPQALAENWKLYTALLVAELGGEPVAYTCLTQNRIPLTTWVTDLVVTPRHRRQGIGSTMVLAALDWVAGQGHTNRLILELQPKNYPAIRLSQKLGFDFCGYLDHYYANNDIGIFFAKWVI